MKDAKEIAERFLMILRSNPRVEKFNLRRHELELIAKVLIELEATVTNLTQLTKDVTGLTAAVTDLSAAIAANPPTSTVDYTEIDTEILNAANAIMTATNQITAASSPPVSNQPA